MWPAAGRGARAHLTLGSNAAADVDLPAHFDLPPPNRLPEHGMCPRALLLPLCVSCAYIA